MSISNLLEVKEHTTVDNTCVCSMRVLAVTLEHETSLCLVLHTSIPKFKFMGAEKIASMLQLNCILCVVTLTLLSAFFSVMWQDCSGFHIQRFVATTLLSF